MKRGMSRDPLGDHLRHLQVRNLRPTTIASRRAHIYRLAAALRVAPDDTLLAVTRTDLERWQEGLSRHSPNHRKTATSHTRAFYGWAVVADLIDRNPAVTLAAVRVPATLPRPIGEDDLDFAIACAPDRLRAMLVLAAYQGLRACEIATLHREDVHDHADPPVLFVTGKGGKQRVVPLSERAILELRAHGLPVRGYVFGRFDGGPGGNTPARVSKLCNRYLHGMGITDQMHSLRHRFGTAAYGVSRDLRVTQELMGHSSPQTTAGYVAWSHAAAVSAVNGIRGATLHGSQVLPVT